MPLAAEPIAAAVDLVLECPATDFTRTSLVALLRSPHFNFAGDGAVAPESIAALDRGLSSARYLGGRERLEALASADRGDRQLPPEADAALDLTAALSHSLAVFQDTAPASSHLFGLIAFLDGHWIQPTSSRERRAQAAVRDTLTALATAQARFHDPPWSIQDLVAAVRLWIGEQTFAPEASDTGLRLVDDRAARYGDYSDIFVVGLVEDDWPERPARNIFYPAPLLKALGWPTERDRRAAADARFLDLIESASERVSLSTFTLEDEGLVMRSTQLDELSRAKLSTLSVTVKDLEVRVHRDDLLAMPGTKSDIDCSARSEIDCRPGPFGPGNDQSWLALRTTRTESASPAFHGAVGAQPPRPWSVSALETYLDCPFKFFARHVLRLQEQPEDEEMIDPRRQGRLVHEVFETFFRDWQASGRRAITVKNLDEARTMFTAVVDRLLADVPPAEAGLERTRLLGSSAAAGLGEAVFRMEAERRVEVVERLLEHRLDGEFVLKTENGERRVSLRAKADRLDLLADGTFRLIDYKLGWPPNRARALQLPVYALCAEQQLLGRRSLGEGGRHWTLGEAAYLAFKGPRRVVPLFSSTEERDTVLQAAATRLTNTIDAIERGEFPPTPDDVFRCESCSFAAVCRKDYVGDV
jgi:RecB family exonuclease